jgi:pimeloyl-ACP methyl ester carboxylesterase
MDARAHMTPSKVRAGGLEFAYFEEGRGPLVLLVHGFPDTPHTWDRVRPALAQAGYRAVSPFTRGYAPTEIPRDGRYDVDTLGQDIAALIEALGEERAIVVGHDWGAAAGYSAAALHPERVRLLVTLAIPHPGGIAPTPRLFWSVRHMFYLSRPHAPRRVRQDDFAYLDELVRRWSPGWNVPPGETDAVKDVFRHPGSLEAALAYYRAIRPWPTPAQRHKIGVPTVSFSGDTDVIGREAWERARRSFTARYEVVPVPGGHFLHREHPERFTTELLAALKRFGV